jgi:peptidoglycan/LPS O-acetylase OafA/YrhL
MVSLPIELFGQLLTPWRLPLLFMISGAATWHALGTRSASAYARDRFMRLMLPLGFGMLVVIPPQVYVERISHGMPNRQSPIDFTGSYLDFQSVASSGIYPNGNFSWHHLWFLVYLFAISVAALPLLRWLRTPNGERWRGRIVDAVASPARVFLPAVVVVVIHVALRGRYPNTYALVGDWWNLAHYATLFVLGYVLVADARFRVATERARHVAAVLWVAVAVARIAWFLTMPPAPPYSAGYVVALTLRGCAEWLALVAVLGYASRHLDRPSAALRWAGDRVPPFYIWHQTVIVVVAYYVIAWPAPAAVKWPSIALVSLAITLALTEAVSRFSLTRVLFGSRPRPR